MSGTTDNLLKSDLPAAIKTVGSAVIPYHERLNQDRGWALSEGSLFFEGKGKVQEALRRITKRLDELQIPYAVVGGMALFKHGYRRFTEDVDLLVTKDALEQIHSKLEGLGYVRPFAGSKHLRDTDAGVKIEFLVTGGFPGDGKPKPVVFPNPAQAAVNIDGIKVISLPKLFDLKLASGISNPHRLNDLADVQQFAKHVQLPQDFVLQLDPSVRDKFVELCANIKPADIEAEEIGE